MCVNRIDSPPNYRAQARHSPIRGNSGHPEVSRPGPPYVGLKQLPIFTDIIQLRWFGWQGTFGGAEQSYTTGIGFGSAL